MRPVDAAATSSLPRVLGALAWRPRRRHLRAAIAHRPRPDVVILDDFRLKPLPAAGPEDFDEVINERYERGALINTSNHAFTEWPDLFQSPLLLSALPTSRPSLPAGLSGCPRRCARRTRGRVRPSPRPIPTRSQSHPKSSIVRCKVLRKCLGHDRPAVVTNRGPVRRGESNPQLASAL